MTSNVYFSSKVDSDSLLHIANQLILIDYLLCLNISKKIIKK